MGGRSLVLVGDDAGHTLLVTEMLLEVAHDSELTCFATLQSVLDSAAAAEQCATASADPAVVFADRSRYQEYSALYGNVSHESRHDYWTSPVDPPSGGKG